MYHETRSVYSDIHLPEKNNITTPRPITDSKLKRALSKDEDLVKFNVTPQDEKILALMVKRGEWERKYWKKKLKNAIAWDKEKTASDEHRADTDRQHRACVEASREDDRQSVKLRKIAREKKHQEKKRQLEMDVQKAETKSINLLAEQQKLKEKQRKERKEKEEKDKENQVKHWWEVNSQEYEKKYNDHLEHDRKRLHAGVKREEIIHDETERIARENETERLAFTERYVNYRRKLKNSTNNLIIRIDRRMHTAEVNYESEKKKREDKIRQDVLEEQHKLEHAIKTQQKQAKKRQKVAKHLWKKDSKKIEQANESVISTLETTAKHIREERLKHEEEQKKNLKQVQKKINAWKKKLRKDIKARDEKIMQLQAERVSVMEKTRSVAHDSRILRNKVLDKYGSESFDKKLFRVQRFHSLGTRPSTQDWNTSTISLL